MVRHRLPRLRNPLIARFLLLPLVLLVGGCAWEQAKFKQTTNVNAPHTAGSALHVETRNGWITVHKAATPDGQVSIAATRRCTW